MMTSFEMTTRSSGNIGLLDRAVRIAFGLAVLFGALYASVEGVEAYPILKLIAASVVLTGIAGWDPLYALYRSAIKYFKKINSRKYIFTKPRIA